MIRKEDHVKRMKRVRIYGEVNDSEQGERGIQRLYRLALRSLEMKIKQFL